MEHIERFMRRRGNGADPIIMQRGASSYEMMALWRINERAVSETAAIIISFVIAVAIAGAQSILTIAVSMARRSRSQRN